MWNMNSGYSGYSMSNRAVDAYEDGEMPLSKWTKKMIISLNLAKIHMVAKREVVYRPVRCDTCC